MKRLILLVLGITLCCGPTEAQSLLKKLGEAVEKKVVDKVSDAVVDGVSKEIKKAVSGKNNKKQKKSPSDTTQSQPASSSEDTFILLQDPVKPSTSAAMQKSGNLVDEGQNITREEGLDYIDEYGINHGGGILIGDILWAPVNCGYHETDYPYGKLYQWGRKHGQGYGAPYANEFGEVNPDKNVGEIVPAPVTPDEALKHPDTFYAHSKMALFNWTRNDMSLWCPLIDEGLADKSEKYDPCPEGWRLPELFDFKSLAEHYSDLVEYPEGGPKGRWFSGPEAYSTDVPRIFLPAAGLRNPDGTSCSRNREGAYWTLRHAGGEGMVWHLYFNDTKAMVYQMAYPHEAYSVRCVKDIKGQKLR